MSNPVHLTTVRIELLPHADAPHLPGRATAHAAGYDLRAAILDPCVLQPGERGLIPAGFRMELPPNVEAQIRPRSGLAMKHGVTVLNSPGTIDPDFRGEVHVLLINLGAEAFPIRRGDRIAQMVFARFRAPLIAQADDLGVTDRGAGGFGSTGTR